MKKSTKDLFRLQKGLGITSMYRFLHAYWYLAKTDHYIKVLLGTLSFVLKYFPPRVGRWAMGLVIPYYHGKVMRTEDIKKVLTLNVDLQVADNIAEKVVPFDVARSIVIEHPDHIVVQDCACRQYKESKGEKACSSEKYGIQCCMFIGEPFVSFILEHSKNNVQKLTVKEAVERLEDVHSRGWASTMFFKDAMGERSYAICNCCPCCCIGLKFHREVIPSLHYPLKQYVPSGYAAKIVEEKCTGCELCMDICPFGACTFEADEEKAAVAYEKCMGCGACVDQCPAGAISLVQDPQKGVPLDVDILREKHG